MVHFPPLGTDEAIVMSNRYSTTHL